MRIITNVVVILFLFTGVAMASDLNLYRFDQASKAAFQQSVDAIDHPSGTRKMTTYNYNMSSITEETDTSVRINVSDMFLKFHHVNSNNPNISTLYTYSLSADIECLFSSYYEWRCLYQNINQKLDKRLQDYDNMIFRSEITNSFFTAQYREMWLTSFEDYLSEVY